MYVLLCRTSMIQVNGKKEFYNIKSTNRILKIIQAKDSLIRNNELRNKLLPQQRNNTAAVINWFKTKTNRNL